MNVSTNALKEALRSYAVLLDRRGWLDPEYLDAQISSWSSVIKRDRREGELIAADVEVAIAEMLRSKPYSPPPSPRDITPMRVIEQACKLASQRRARAEWHLLLPEDSLVYEERVQLMHSTVPEAAAARYRTACVDAIADLQDSGLPEHLTAPRIDLIVADMAKWLAQYPQLGRG